MNTGCVIILLISLLPGIIIAQSQRDVAEDDEYRSAMAHLEDIERTYQRKYILTAENVENNLYIPQFDSKTGNYRTSLELETPPPPLLVQEVIPLLETAASQNHSEAAVTLADLFMFGNFSLPPDYKKAKQYYEKALSIAPNGHAYFMLGFIYSTGMFGEFEADPERGNLYYQFAMENGDINALLVLAYRNLKGIVVPQDCEMALPIYSKLASIGLHWISNWNHPNEVSYNIRISDFNGGIFGEKLSETSSSIKMRSRVYADLKQSFEETKLNANDHEYVSLYYDGVGHMMGDYFVSRNLTKAFLKFQQCVELGEEIYGANDYKNVGSIDRMYLSSCQTHLARMYFKGVSVPRNVAKAEHYYNMSLKVQATPEVLNDLAVIEEEGLLKKANYSRAVELYASAVAKKSPEANKNLAKLMMKIYGDDLSANAHRSEVYKHMKDAAYLGDTEALFYMGRFLESGLAASADPAEQITCSKTVMYYREFVKRLSRFFTPHLKYAFEELKCGNYKNSLVGYSIAAEQGFEPAQVSAAYLLYQLQPLSEATKVFAVSRVKNAMKYLDGASRQANVDATILLGSLLAGEDPKAQIETDPERAFSYFRLAADRHSSYGAYKLAEMYENGLGPVNNTTDYYLAKRYYDQSLQYREKFDFDRSVTLNKGSLNKAHISWAMLRLRFKYLFNRKAFKNNQMENSSDSWLNAFKKIGKKSPNKEKDFESREHNSRADAHHLGGTHEHDYVESYDLGDYLVIALTFVFFSIFFFQNVLRQVRQIRNGRPLAANQNREAAGAGGARGNENGEQNWGWNGNQFNFRRGNFEFHFFAI